MSENADDLTARSDVLDSKIAEVGGPEALVASLAKGLSRLTWYILITGGGVVMDILISIVLFYVISTVNHNNHAQQVVNWQQCNVVAADTVKINSTDRSYANYLKSLPPAATPQLAANRLGTEQIYEKAILATPVCGPRP